MTKDEKEKTYKAMTNTELLKEYKSKREIYSEAKADKELLEAAIIKRMGIKQGEKDNLKGKGITLALDWTKSTKRTDWDKVAIDFNIDKDKYPKYVPTKKWNIV